MKKKLLLITTFLLFSIFSAISQKKYTVSGTVEDLETGESILYANVYDAKTLGGTITNFYGFYSLTLEEGTVELTFSYVGYETQTFLFYLESDTVINVSLNPNIEIEEVVISAEDQRSAVQNTQMSMIELPVLQAKQLPVLLGEVDILKSIQLMPGVQSGTEGTSGIYVRGGGPDQNLILLDGVPVYNANHLFGFFSVFNADAIQNVSLIKGGFPARYGGRLSSVIDIKMKEGNSKEFKGEGSVGLISSKLALEGPIIKDKTSFIVSGRRTYIDVLSWPIQKIYSKSQGDDFNEYAGYYFYDINAKINHKFSNKSRIYLSSYLGKDRAYFRYKDKYSYDTIQVKDKEVAGLDWGNITTALRWNYIFSPKLFANFTGTYSRYRFNIKEEYHSEEEWPSRTVYEDYLYNYYSGITDYAAKADFDFIPNSNHYIRFGTNMTWHTFHPGINVYRESDSYYEDSTPVDTSFGNKNIYAEEFSAYIEDEIKIGRKLKTNFGLHYSGFSVRGEYYQSFQPRISTRYLATDNLSIKASYVKMAQHIHLLTNSTIGLPTDLWVPATNKIKPQKAWQIAMGAAYNLNNKYEFSIEGYYKEMDKLIEYKEGASFFSVQDDWEDKLESGKGWSRGIEFFVQKKTGKLTGWIGYTLSKTDRQFENISFGHIFPYKFDRRHDISIVTSYKLDERIDVGFSWVYGTGLATTLPEEKYVSPLSQFANYEHQKKYGGYYWYGNNEMIEHFEHRNSYRMPHYHRLDAGINIHKKTKWGERTWSIGTYNAYSRMNPFYIYIGEEYNENNQQYKKVIKQVSLFPVIPYIRYSFKF